VGRIRAAMPGIALTTDVIVGFPGETEDDFRETLEVVDEVGFDHAYTFVYSPRRGTDAATMDDQVPEQVKRDRITRLVDLVQRHAAARNAALVGTVQEVLVEGPSRTDAEVLRGRTRGNKTTLFRGQAAAGADHPIGVWPLDPEGSVGEYAEMARAAVDDVVSRGRTAIVCGGSGLYLRAALAPLDLPPPPAVGVREKFGELYDRRGAEAA